jgi:hypothetical protein
MPLRRLALRLGTSGRDVQVLVGELIGEGHPIGSSCTPGQAGFFLIETQEDLEEGTRHLRSRALSSLRRVSLLRKAAAARFGPEALHLFELDREAS